MFSVVGHRCRDAQILTRTSAAKFWSCGMRAPTSLRSSSEITASRQRCGSVILGMGLSLSPASSQSPSKPFVGGGFGSLEPGRSRPLRGYLRLPQKRKPVHAAAAIHVITQEDRAPLGGQRTGRDIPHGAGDGGGPRQFSWMVRRRPRIRLCVCEQIARVAGWPQHLYAVVRPASFGKRWTRCWRISIASR